MPYCHLGPAQRYEIQTMHKLGYTQRRIARELGVNKSTVSRELRRNREKGKAYCAETAGLLALARRARKPVKITPEVETFLFLLMHSKISPAAAAGRIRLELGVSISPEAVYLHIRRDSRLHRWLLRAGKKRRSRLKAAGLSHIKDRTPISERPPEANGRQRIGDWEADTVVSKDHLGGAATAVCRHSRFLVARLVPDLTAATVCGALRDALGQAAADGKCLTVTTDNGKEFAGHKEAAAALGADWFFCAPYASYQRGTNENLNGVLRRYYPKKTDLRLVDPAEFERVVAQINHMPRKCLGYRTPYEVFYGLEIEPLIPKLVALRA